MNTRELLAKVRQLEIKTRGLSNQLFSGSYRTTFKGRGMSFSEVREYQYGDDVRNIDWNVTARSSTPHVKVFEEERELTIFLMIDVSGSAFFGTRSQTKDERVAEIAATLAFSGIMNNDKIGAIFFADEVEYFMPPKKGRGHLLRIIRELVYRRPKGKGTDLAKALRYLSNVVRKRCTAFILSDFMTKGYEDALKLAAQRHDVVGIRLFDAAEEQLPDVGLLRVFDAESQQTRWLDTSSKKMRKRYEKWYLEHIQHYQQSFWKSKSDAISLSTEDAYIVKLKTFFNQRKR